MTTKPEQGALSLDEAHDHISKTSFRFDQPGAVGQVGLEPEFFPILTDSSGAPAGRLPLLAKPGAVEFIEELVRTGSWVLPRESPDKLLYLLENGGNISFEPGGQIEHSTKPHDSGGAALADVEQFLEYLVPVARKAGVSLAGIGTDIWHGVESIPLQLDHWRYRSMQTSFDRRGIFGRVMMRHTATTQINLDLGPPGIGEERFLLANLVSPIVTASFACSPTLGASSEMNIDGVSSRAIAWQGLDPSRTGFPAALVAGRDSFAGAWAEAVLDADVMLFKDGDGAELAEGGFTFAKWIAEGHPEHGLPTRADLDYHLTTVFFEVRARGFLELRAADGLPTRWRAAPIVFACGLLYDDTARNAALELVCGTHAELDVDWHTAGRVGLRDAKLQERASALWEIALRGAENLAKGYFREQDLKVSREYAERFVHAGRMPVDELLEAYDESPTAALVWASE